MKNIGIYLLIVVAIITGIKAEKAIDLTELRLWMATILIGDLLTEQSTTGTGVSATSGEDWVAEKCRLGIYVGTLDGMFCRG